MSSQVDLRSLNWHRSGLRGKFQVSLVNFMFSDIRTFAFRQNVATPAEAWRPNNRKKYFIFESSTFFQFGSSHFERQFILDHQSWGRNRIVRTENIKFEQRTRRLEHFVRTVLEKPSWHSLGRAYHQPIARR